MLAQLKPRRGLTGQKLPGRVPGRVPLGPSIRERSKTSPGAFPITAAGSFPRFSPGPFPI